MMLLNQARIIAQSWRDRLAPFCSRIEIGGSIRRNKPEVKDIELVAIRDPKRIRELKEVIDRLYKIKGNVLGKYTQRSLPEGIKLDLFFADKENFGTILLIRTGPWEFSKRMMSTVTNGKGYIQDGGYLWDAEGKKVPVAEEADWFKLMGIDFVEPERRR